MQPSFDRLPPHNLEAEMGVLGSMILDPTCIDEVRLTIRADDFYRNDYAIIFRTILAVLDANRPVDPITVDEELRRTDRFDEVGGSATLVKLVESIPHAAHALTYADLIRQKAILREVIAASHENLKRAYSHDYTAQEVLEFVQRAAFSLGDRREAHRVTTIGKAAVESLRRLDMRLAGVRPGLMTGLSDYDALTGGFQPGQLIILAARPAIGKTALALNVADFIATDSQVGTLFVSLEMTEEELADRAICGRAHVDGSKFADPSRLSEVDLAALTRAVARLESSPLYLSDEVAQTVSDIASQARRFRAKEQIGLLVVDYLQLVDADEKHRAPRHEQVAMMTRGLKNLAKVLKIPILLLCQLNRKAEDREDHRPRMSDLRESGTIEQDANVVLLLHRPEHYDPNDRPGEAELIVAKNRGGPTDTVKLRFDRAITQFRDFNSPSGEERTAF